MNHQDDRDFRFIGSLLLISLVEVVAEIVLLILKCCGIVDWAWVWILSPVWMGPTFILISWGIFVLVYLVQERCKK